MVIKRPHGLLNPDSINGIAYVDWQIVEYRSLRNTLQSLNAHITDNEGILRKTNARNDEQQTSERQEQILKWPEMIYLRFHCSKNTFAKHCLFN